jgi:hypothetical protein
MPTAGADSGDPKTRASRLLFVRFITATATVFANAEFPEQDLRRAKAGEGGLNEIHADKHIQKQPPGTNKVDQGSTDEDHGAGNDSNEGFSFH